MSDQQLQAVLAKIDALNGQDPHPDTEGGTGQPHALAYAKRVTDWVGQLEPAASEELRIAARGGHICRWEIPRDRYEKNRKGYLQWREALKGFHAQKVAELMKEAGYSGESISRVERIIRKKNIRDPETQTVEDALCLVFLQTQFTPLREKEPEAKMLEILRKTWRKMGEKGRSAAAALQLPKEETALLQKALQT